MKAKEFNLLKEPWIRVVDLSLEMKEVNLKDVLINSHKYKRLSGETPTQDVAIFRILLAIVLTIFYRYDENGEKSDLINKKGVPNEKVKERFRGYYKDGKFNDKICEVINKYLDEYYESFDLFDSETPFYQVKNFDKKPTSYNIESLLGNIKGSKNSATTANFSMRIICDEKKYKLTYAEAARWLVHLNGYHVKIQNPPKIGTGLLGEMGFFMVDGDNLFQKLMFNLCPLKDNELWEAPNPVWGKGVGNECKQINPPNNLPEFYTIQSRQKKLRCDNEGNIVGIDVRGGEYFAKIDRNKDPEREQYSKLQKYIADPMTLIDVIEKDNPKHLFFIPKKHKSNIKIWREFKNFFPISKDEREKKVPFLKLWIEKICNKNWISLPNFITFKTIGMQYDGFSYENCIYDEISLSVKIISELNKEWQKRINDEIDTCQNDVVKILSAFANDMKNIYSDGSKQNGIKDRLVNQYFFLIDSPFRTWLRSINPDEDSLDEKMSEWREQSLYYAKKTVKDYVSTCDRDVYISRRRKKGKKDELLTLPKILNICISRLDKIYKN